MSVYTLTTTQSAPSNIYTEAFRTALENQNGQPIHHDTLIEVVLESLSDVEGKSIGEILPPNSPFRDVTLETSLRTVKKFFPDLGKLIYGK